jgi:hypothetical protein
MSTRILLAIALLLWSVAPADAALVQWHFEGPADGFWPPVAAGSPVLLDWAFDTTAPNLQEVRGIPDSSFYYVNNVALTFGGWRYPSYATLESAFDLRDGDSSGQNLVALRLFWLGQAVQIDPSAPGLPHGVAPFCDWPNCDSYLLLPPASVLGGMPPAGGSLVSDVPYPATLYLESYGAATHIQGEVVATPEPTSLLILGTGCLAVMASRRGRQRN